MLPGRKPAQAECGGRYQNVHCRRDIGCLFRSEQDDEEEPGGECADNRAKSIGAVEAAYPRTQPAKFPDEQLAQHGESAAHEKRRNDQD